MSQHHNIIIEYYKDIYENMKRDHDRILQVMHIMKETMDNMRETITNLQEDNRSLRQHMLLMNHREMRENRGGRVYIDIIDEDEKEQEQLRQMPTYSIPPHVRQVYLNNVQDPSCAICINQLQIDREPVELTDCGHLFHNECLRRHRENNNNCPICRTEI